MSESIDIRISKSDWQVLPGWGGVSGLHFWEDRGAQRKLDEVLRDLNHTLASRSRTHGGWSPTRDVVHTLMKPLIRFYMRCSTKQSEFGEDILPLYCTYLVSGYMMLAEKFSRLLSAPQDRDTLMENWRDIYGYATVQLMEIKIWLVTADAHVEDNWPLGDGRSSLCDELECILSERHEDGIDATLMDGTREVLTIMDNNLLDEMDFSAVYRGWKGIQNLALSHYYILSTHENHVAVKPYVLTSYEDTEETEGQHAKE